MSEVLLCKLTVSNLTPVEQDELKSAIELTSAKIQSETNRVFVVDDVLEILITVAITKVAEKTVESAGKELAKVIKKWRQERQQAEKQISGNLERPNHPPLNLDTTTDEEIDEWF